MRDVMVIHHDSLSILARLDKYFKLKPSSVGDPTMYLGATVKKSPGQWRFGLGN
jgi:hypothetical protein